MDKSLKTKNLLRLNNEEIENLNKLKKKNPPKKQKCKIRSLHRGILPNIFKKVNTYPSQTVLEN